ncbi:uncharacterized protein METZ01_LOCUS202581, partial [marine metagenome]
VQPPYPRSTVPSDYFEQAKVLLSAWLGVASLRHGTGAKHRESSILSCPT